MAVAHQTVHIDRVKRYFLHEIQGHHDHSGHPEEDDVEAGDQHTAGVESPQEFGDIRVVIGIGPAQGAKGPQAGREPGVQYILVLFQDSLAEIVTFAHVFFAAAHVNIALIVIPGGNAVAPPQLPGNAPVLNIAHPGEVHVLVLFGHELDTAAFHGINGLFRQWCGFYVPLVGEVGFDHHPGAVAPGYFQFVVIDLFQ